MPVQRNFAEMLHRYFSFDGRISRKEFLYGLLEVFLFGLFFCLPLMIVFAGVKTSDASKIIIQSLALLLLILLSICLWAQCALLVKRGHDRGLSGTPMFGIISFILFFIGNAAFEVMGGESYIHLIFPKDRYDHLVFNAIFFAFGIYINFLFWSGLKKGSAAGAEEFGPPPTPDEEVGFWTLK
jgi:uncharacterized membrane protein YhaH (DUF805 family)